MKTPIFKIDGLLSTFYVFGEEKLINMMSDDGLPFNLLDKKLKELENDIIILKTLTIEKLQFQIGEEVTDSVGHNLKIITVDHHGTFVVGDQDNNAVKYYNESQLLKPNFKGSPQSVTAAEIEEIGFSRDLMADFNALFNENESK